MFSLNKTCTEMDYHNYLCDTTDMSEVPSFSVAFVHDCDQPDCDERFKHPYHLKRHMAFIHDVGVWHDCHGASYQWEYVSVY